MFLKIFQQIKVHSHRVIARFGLMHMIGTNLSVWLNVLVQETKHEILTFYDPENNSLRISHRLGKLTSSRHDDYNRIQITNSRPYLQVRRPVTCTLPVRLTVITRTTSRRVSNTLD